MKMTGTVSEAVEVWTRYFEDETQSSSVLQAEVTAAIREDTELELEVTALQQCPWKTVYRVWRLD